MRKKEFEKLLDNVCAILTDMAQQGKYKTAKAFEDGVREVINDTMPFDVDFHSPAQAFPDIALGEYGVEVKFTLADTWRSVANSVQERQRVESVKHIYIVFGKMGGVPQVRWGEYEQSVVHVRTSHVPRFEVELPADGEERRESLFEQMGIRYDDFRKLDMAEKMKYIRAYARKIHPDGRLWWIEDSTGEEHTTPAQARLYTKLPQEEKNRLRAEAALLCPGVVRSGRVRDKYDDVVLFLLTYHGVLCHQARDLFSAGSAAGLNHAGDGRPYIEIALQRLEKEMLAAANYMDMALFEEYWGESCEPENRINRWLEKADGLASGWVPSKSLFIKK